MIRFIRCSPVDEAAVVDVNNHELAAGYRIAVAAALPNDAVPTPEFWTELADIIVDYFVLAELRATQPDLDRMQRIISLVDALNTEIRATHRPALSQWSLISGRLLSTLWSVRAFAETFIAGYGRIIPTFKGRSNPYRQMLYDRVLDLWCRHFDSELRISRTDGRVSGPLIKFFKAVTAPVLGDKAPKADGIAAIVARHTHTTSEV
jgi:hypothetical protein